jgi:hypothetical protein
MKKDTLLLRLTDFLHVVSKIESLQNLFKKRGNRKETKKF